MDREFQKRLLVILAFTAATSLAILAPFVQFSALIPAQVYRTVVFGCGGIAATLFAVWILDPNSHRALADANAELQGDNPLRLVSVFDESWGLFGAKLGSGYLPVLRTILFLECMTALVMKPIAAPPLDAPPLVLTFVGLVIAILLTLDQLKQQYPR